MQKLYVIIIVAKVDVGLYNVNRRQIDREIDSWFLTPSQPWRLFQGEAAIRAVPTPCSKCVRTTALTFRILSNQTCWNKKTGSRKKNCHIVAYFVKTLSSEKIVDRIFHATAALLRHVAHTHTPKKNQHRNPQRRNLNRDLFHFSWEAPFQNLTLMRWMVTKINDTAQPRLKVPPCITTRARWNLPGCRWREHLG